MSYPHIPGYVVIGHVTKDLLPGGSTAGGTALYSSLTASRLGVPAAVVTAVAAEDSDLLAQLQQEDIACARKASDVTTTFVNHYQGFHRWQEIHAVGALIEPADVPAQWTQAAILHLGPVAQEMDATAPWAELFPGALIGVTPQGWLRSWNAEGRVAAAEWESAALVLPRVHVLVMSAEDVGNDDERLMRYVRLAPLAIVTAGPDAAAIYEYGREVAIVPAVNANPVDFTGAGDVFTTAFLVRYQEIKDAITAVRFAHATAAIAIEAEGSAGIPSRAKVEQRLRDDA